MGDHHHGPGAVAAAGVLLLACGMAALGVAVVLVTLALLDAFALPAR